MKENKIKKIGIASIFSIILAMPISTLLTNLIHNIIIEKRLIQDNLISLFYFPKNNDLMLFIAFTVLLFLTFIYALLHSDRKYIKYDEHNIEIMKGIIIPKPIKNKFQYGSSWFLEKEKFKETFSYNTLEDNKLIRNLLFNRKVEEEVFRKYKFEKGGISLGLERVGDKEIIYFNDEDTHSIVLGATRSGKGRTVLLQTIGIQGLAGESMILSDPKGELYCFTKPFLENLGYEVIALDFEEPEKSNSYNFLQNVIDYVNENDITRAIDSVEDIVDMLVERSGNEPIWENGEKSILAFAILLIVIENKENPKNRF